MSKPSQKLRSVRRDRGVKQKHLAQALGIAQSTLSNVENGHHRAWPSLRKRAAQFFGVSEDVLFPESTNEGDQ